MKDQGDCSTDLFFDSGNLLVFACAKKKFTILIQSFNSQSQNTF